MINGGKQASKDENAGDYMVKQGDTLSKIVREQYPDATSKELSEKIKETAKNSGIENPDLIHPGQKIVFDDKKASEPPSSTAPSEPSRPKTGSSSRTSNEEYWDEPDYSERGDTEPDMTENTPNKQETSAAQETYASKEKQVTGNEQHSPDGKNSNKQESSFGISLANIETKDSIFKYNNRLKEINNYNKLIGTTNSNIHHNNLERITQELSNYDYKKKDKNEYDPDANIFKGQDPKSLTNTIVNFATNHYEKLPLLGGFGLIAGALYLGNETVRNGINSLIETRGTITKPLNENSNFSFSSLPGTSNTKDGGTLYYLQPQFGIDIKTPFKSGAGAGNIYVENRIRTNLDVYSTKTGPFPQLTGKDNNPFSTLQVDIGVQIQY
ncbi:LysM peptidoglycan-binding domain-containing protein [Treponema denticola]|nr:LysM peptidoglycan-binding domain-containing protein [Treponema denticola]